MVVCTLMADVAIEVGSGVGSSLFYEGETQSRMAHTRLLNQRTAWWLSAVFRDNNHLSLEGFEN